MRWCGWVCDGLRQPDVRSGLVVLVTILGVSACGTPDDRAESDARGLVSERLAAIEADLVTSLPEFDPIADAAAIATWVPSTYSHSIEGNTLTLEFGVRAVGRDPSSVGASTIAGGACFQVIGDSSGGTISQVDCPSSFLDEPGLPVEVEVHLIDERRPLKGRDS